jgi:predicted transcriptional regulator
MYYRQHITQKIENLEAKLKHIEFHNGRGNRQEVEKVNKKCEEIVDEIKSIIEREPRTENEQNRV